MTPSHHVPKKSVPSHETTIIRGLQSSCRIQIIAMRLQRLQRLRLPPYPSFIAFLPISESGKGVTLDRHRGDLLDELGSDRQPEKDDVADFC